MPDRFNNVERVLLSPAAGGETVSLNVSAFAIPFGTQLYSLVVVGPPGMNMSGSPVGASPPSVSVAAAAAAGANAGSGSRMPVRHRTVAMFGVAWCWRAALLERSIQCLHPRDLRHRIHV